MKYFLSLLCFATISMVFAQPNTDVFLFNLKTTNNSIVLSMDRNISNNAGYDNQPSFLDNNTVLYARTRNGQTDIAKHNLKNNAEVFINETEGGEYSPLKIPGKKSISAVRLDKDGKQRLYAYQLKNGNSTELVKDLVVAYYTWFNKHIVVAAVIEDNGLNLYVINTKTGENKKYQDNVGRSFHNIPNSDLVSYISKSDAGWQIKSLNPKTGATKVIATTMEGVEDICWLDETSILSGKESILYLLKVEDNNSWVKVADLNSSGITKITRLATNSKSNKLLIAGEIN